MAKISRLRRADFYRRELDGEMINYSQNFDRSKTPLFFFYMSHVDFHVDSHVDFHVDSEIRKKKYDLNGVIKNSRSPLLLSKKQQGGFLITILLIFQSLKTNDHRLT